MNKNNMTPCIVVMGKGALQMDSFVSGRDAIISIRDYGVTDEPNISWGDCDTLQLRFNDVNDDVIGPVDSFIFNQCHSKMAIRFALCLISRWEAWPCCPFTPYHAKLVVDFVLRSGFNQNIYVHCDYGRSRSVAIGTFIQRYLRPGYDIDIRRKDAALNARVYRLLRQQIKIL